jgi:hypothetical protein
MNKSLSGTDAADEGVSGSCSSDSAGTCVCSEKLNGVSNTETGTYTTSGSALTMISSDSSSDSSDDKVEYCVQGDTLKLHFSSANSTASGTFVATR